MRNLPHIPADVAKALYARAGKVTILCAWTRHACGSKEDVEILVERISARRERYLVDGWSLAVSKLAQGE